MTSGANIPWEGDGRPSNPVPPALSSSGPGDYPPPPGGGYPPPPGGYPPPPGGGYPPPGGGYPGGGYPPPPGGGYPGGGYPGGAWDQGPGGGSFGDLAGWWSRVGATLIDGIIIGIPAFILYYIVGSGGAVGSRVAAEIVVVVAEGIYFTLMLARQGRTVGNMAVGTRVIDARTGGPLSTGRALGRWAAQLLFGLLSVLFFVPTLLDYLWPIWDRRNQTLHDKMAGTLVVYYR